MSNKVILGTQYKQKSLTPTGVINILSVKRDPTDPNNTSLNWVRYETENDRYTRGCYEDEFLEAYKPILTPEVLEVLITSLMPVAENAKSSGCSEQDFIDAAANAYYRTINK